MVHSPTSRKTKKTMFSTPRKEEHTEPEECQATQEDKQRLVLATPKKKMLNQLPLSLLHQVKLW